MKKTLFLLLYLSLPIIGFSQDFEVPEYELKTAEDYKPLEDDILKCIDWLENTPLNAKNDNKRKEASMFLLDWVEGAPNVMIVLNMDLIEYSSKHPDLLTIFIGGWTKESILKQKKDMTIEGGIKGLESVITFYNKNKSVIGKSKAIEKYIKHKKKGELELFVKKAFDESKL